MNDAARRILDITVATTGLVLLSPLMAVIAVIIRKDSSGPAIFRQVRVGQHGRCFTLYKFRTMYKNQCGPSVTAEGDHRVTPIGRRLRATKLDELPQLANVLAGDMTLVGPRPEIPTFVGRWPTADRQAILSVRPGMTDPITLKLLHEERLLAHAVDPDVHYEQVLLPAKARAYSAYLTTRTLRRDVITMLKTIFAVTNLNR